MDNQNITETLEESKKMAEEAKDKLGFVLLVGLAAGNVIERQIPKQDNEEVLKKIIRLAGHSCIQWKEVRDLAEKRIKEVLGRN